MHTCEVIPQRSWEGPMNPPLLQPPTFPGDSYLKHWKTVELLYATGQVLNGYVTSP